MGEPNTPLQENRGKSAHIKQQAGEIDLDLYLNETTDYMYKRRNNHFASSLSSCTPLRDSTTLSVRSGNSSLIVCRQSLNGSCSMR